MGLRGPAPKPTAVRQLEGNLSKRPLPMNEPRYRQARLSPPKYISARARKVWHELATELSAAGVLRTVDRRAFWQLCEDEALLQLAYEGINKTLGTFENAAKLAGRTLPQGPLMPMLAMPSNRLAMAAIRDLAARVMIARREFGLTASSRSRIDAGSGFGGSFDPLEEKLCGAVPLVN